MTVPAPDLDWEGHVKFRPAAAAQTAISIIPKAAQTANLITVRASDGSDPVVVGAGVTTLGSIGVAGPTILVKTNGAPTDADFTQATPAMPIPPVGTIAVVLSSAKIYVKTAAAAGWASSVALT
jgi:hypothetical protein